MTVIGVAFASNRQVLSCAEAKLVGGGSSIEYRKFGPTDLTVSALRFGCVEYGGGEYGDQMSAALHRAIDVGITCLDTAPNYGDGASERMLGGALGPRRKDVVVVTKCGLGYQNSPVGRPKGRDSRRESIHLERLAPSRRTCIGPVNLAGCRGG